MNKWIVLCMFGLVGCSKPINNVKSDTRGDVNAGVTAIKEFQPEPAQIKSIEKYSHKVKNTKTLLSNALNQAKQRPQDSRFLNATTIYDFVPGNIYQVYTAPQKITMISFEPNEFMVAPPQSGDTVRWQVNSIISGSGHDSRQHLIIKPLREELNNNMIVTTNKGRIYLLELISTKDHYMLEVSWNCFANDLFVDDAAKTNDSTVDVLSKKLNFAYKIINKAGRPLWKPTKVFDDGEKTFIEFPASINQHELPTLFIVSRESETQLVNYRQKGETLIVDRLFTEAELRLGLLHPEIVRIKRNKPLWKT